MAGNNTNYDLDVIQLNKYYEITPPSPGTDEWLEDAENTDRIKHYVYNGAVWEYKGFEHRSNVIVADDAAVAATNQAGQANVAPKAVKRTKKAAVKTVSNDGTATATATAATMPTVTVTPCVTPKRGSKKIVNALVALASMISTNKTDKALNKIQQMMTDLDVSKDKEPKEKKKPTPYNMFMSENMAEIKREDPTLTASQRLTLATGRWNAKKAANASSSAAALPGVC